MPMKCLRCDSDAINGKALCADCYTSHESQLKNEDDDAWVIKTLKTTRAIANKELAGNSPSLNPRQLSLIAGSACFIVAAILALAILLQDKPSENPDYNQESPYSESQ